MNEQEKEIAKLCKRHVGDLKTLWRVYNVEKEFYRAPYVKTTVLFSLLIILLVGISNCTFFLVITKVTNIALAILPNLLGFNLGAYILVVGFGSTDILKDITEPLENKGQFSLYQQLNGILGVSVIFQIFALILFFFVSIIIELSFTVFFPNLFYIAFNVISLLVLLIGIFYSIFLLVSVVKHVFLFSQTIHFVTTVNKIEEEEVKKKKTE